MNNDLIHMNCFCIGYGMAVFPEKRENFVNVFVMTNTMGNKTFATCWNFDRRLNIEKIGTVML